MNSTDNQNQNTTIHDLARLIRAANENFNNLCSRFTADVAGFGRTTVELNYWAFGGYEVAVGDDTLDRFRNTHSGNRVTVSDNRIEVFGENYARFDIENVENVEVF